MKRSWNYQQWVALIVVPLIVLAGCSQVPQIIQWVNLLAPMVASIIGVIDPALAPTMQQVDTDIQVVTSWFKNWSPGQTIPENVIQAAEAALNSLDNLVPKVPPQIALLIQTLGNALISIIQFAEHQSPQVAAALAQHPNLKRQRVNLGSWVVVSPKTLKKDFNKTAKAAGAKTI